MVSRKRATLLALWLLASRVSAQDADLFDLSLEELQNIAITSVSRKEESIGEAAAAIYVLTGEQIARSGATSLPDVLRLVPGLTVSRIGNHSWAVSSRGMNALYSNKLLVLIDGRVVYSPIFSGVRWDLQDVFLPDIERIEVIRGPGATIWGSNAVNGVINIISKTSSDTIGNLGSVTLGTEERALLGIRHGGTFLESTYRAYLKSSYRDAQKRFPPEEGDSYDAWEHLQTGFRVDSKIGTKDDLRIQGDAYLGRIESEDRGPSFAPPFVVRGRDEGRTHGGNLLTRWRHRFSDGADTTLQMFYDSWERDALPAIEKVDTFDIDGQNRIRLAQWHEVVWGFNYRLIDSDIRSNEKSPTRVNFTKPKESFHLYSIFFQNELEVLKDRLNSTLWFLDP